MKLSEQKSYDQESKPFYPRPTIVSGDMIDLEGVSLISRLSSLRFLICEKSSADVESSRGNIL